MKSKQCRPGVGPCLYKRPSGLKSRSRRRRGVSLPPAEVGKRSCPIFTDAFKANNAQSSAEENMTKDFIQSNYSVEYLSNRRNAIPFFLILISLSFVFNAVQDVGNYPVTNNLTALAHHSNLQFTM
jgi:hypothetical protein